MLLLNLSKLLLSSFNSAVEKLSLNLKREGYLLINNIEEINSDIFKIKPLKLLCLDENIEILSIIINAVISAIVMYLAIKCILSLYSNAYIENIYFFLIKIIIISILSLNSFNICKEIININAMLTDITNSFLEEMSGSKIDYKFLEENISNLDEFFKQANKIGLNGIKDVVFCSYIIFLIVFLSIRYVVVILCIITSPLAFLCNISSNTQKYYYIWFKTYILNLSVQIINKIILFIPICCKDEKKIYIPVLIGSIFVMYRINKLIGEMIYGKNK